MLRPRPAARAAIPAQAGTACAAHRLLSLMGSSVLPMKPLTLAVQLVVLSGAAVFAGAMPTAQAQAPTRAQAEGAQRYDIAPGPLSAVLLQFSSNAGVYLVGSSAQAEGRRSPGLQGLYTVQAGLAALLAGTGLEGFRQADGSYGLRPAASASDDVTTLRPLTVTGRAGRGDAAEGSYTVSASSAATGLELSLRDTPQSVSVITRQRMQDQNLTSMGQVLDVTPGVSVVRAGSSGSPAVGELFYARGFEITNYQLDGIPTNQLGLQAMAGTRSGIGGTSTAIYDQVTVVRGATGLLNGAGNPAASINLVRKRPTSAFQGTAELSAGRWNRYDAQLDFSGPLNTEKTLRGRVVVGGGRGGEWMERHEGAKSGVFYGVLEADLGPGTLLTAGLEYSRNQDRGISFNNFARLDSDGNPTDFSRAANASASWAYADVRRSNVFASIEHEFANQWKARLSVNQTRLDHDQLFGFARGDIDAATGASSFEYGKTIYKPRTTGIEAHVSGPLRLLGREHELMVGLSHENLKASDPSYRYSFGVPVDDIYEFAQTGFIDVPAPVLNGEAYTRIRQTGGYAAIRLRPVDGLAIIAGSRVSNYKIRSNYSDINESGVFTPYVGAVVDISRRVSAYASYTTIFNPQSNQDRYGQTLDPERGQNYELGLKGEFLDGRLNVSAAVFSTRKNNLALLDEGGLTPDGDDAYVAADNTKARGYELEISGALTPNWQLMAGFTQVIVRDNDGMRILQDTPARQLKLFTAYTLSGAWSGLTLGGGVTWRSRTSHPYDPRPELDQGSVAVVDLMARYRYGRHWSATLNVSNLTNRTYLSTVWYHNYGTPRNVTLTLRYQF